MNYFYDLVKSHKTFKVVLPAKAGIQILQTVKKTLDTGACPGQDPGFTGVTTFDDLVSFKSLNIDTLSRKDL